MSPIALVALALLAADEPKWELAKEDDGIKIYSRARDGEDVREMKAMGLMDATPQEVWKAIRDYPHYTKTMPYVQECKVLATEDGGKNMWVYTRLDLPFVSQRDYVLKIVDETNGSPTMKVSWTEWTGDDKNLPEHDGVVRLKINDGYWTLEPKEDGKKTFATYYVHTDPGGSLPKWIANKANSTAVPNVFSAIKKVVADDRAAAAQKK